MIITWNNDVFNIDSEEYIGVLATLQEVDLDLNSIPSQL